MNLLQMLELANKPIVRTHVPRKPRSGNPSPKHVTANRVKHEMTLAKYRTVMKDWLPTVIIEERLGLNKGSVLPVLTNWERRGLVERRPIGEAFNRRKGYEWRFK